MARGSAKMGLKRCCGSLEPFAAILDEFQQRCAFGGNFRNPNIGVFQQNRPNADLSRPQLNGSFVSIAAINGQFYQCVGQMSGFGTMGESFRTCSE